MLAQATATDKKASAEERALERARTQQVMVKQCNGEWLASSVSEPGNWHRVNGSCDCLGAQRGLVCKHKVAMEQVKQGNWHQCVVCGVYSADVRPVTAYVGGHGYQVHYACLDAVQCWLRYDRENGLV